MRGYWYIESSLYIRRELVVFDTHLHALDARLQELACLETCPDLDHGQITRLEKAAAALSAQLSEDWQCTTPVSIDPRDIARTYPEKRSRSGSSDLPMPSRSKIESTTLTKSPSNLT